ncbi:GxxExxY protein [candidate division TA06 bacterium]|nr:GxxExxY protein [candidate division TA06 bacterium]
MHRRDARDSRFGEDAEKDLNGITDRIIGAAIEVHKFLGPGLLESAYEECLAYEFSLRKMRFERQKQVPLRYKDIELDCGYRLDFLVEEKIIVKLKAIEEIYPIHEAQRLSYLKLTERKIGLLLNFNVPVMKKGICRRVLEL